MVAWQQVKCWTCGGCGCISNLDGRPDECPTCGGNHTMWVTENDRIAEYPGGPFRGMSPGKFDPNRTTLSIDQYWRKVAYDFGRQSAFAKEAAKGGDKQMARLRAHLARHWWRLLKAHNHDLKTPPLL